MAENKKTIVAGLGEVGKPLFQLLSPHMEVVGVDIAPVGPIDNVGVLHVCYPFQIPDFRGVTARYIAQYKPTLTVINSTVSRKGCPPRGRRTAVRLRRSEIGICWEPERVANSE